MIEEIIKIIDPKTRVSLVTRHNRYMGSNVGMGFGEDPRNPGADMDYVIVREPGDVDCWVPVDQIKTIEIHTQETP